MNSEVVLEVGSEGGSIAVLRDERGGSGPFWVEIEESMAYDALSQADRDSVAPTSRSGRAASFAEALEQLDRYRWAWLSPIRVHPAFRELVLSAVKTRINGCQDQASRIALDRWTAATTGGSAALRRSPVQEHHLDFLLEEEFAANPALLTFILSEASKNLGESWKAGLPAASSEPNCSSIRSVTTDHGETDVLVIYQSTEVFGRVAILIEDKIRASFQPNQAERYQIRGEEGKSSGEWNNFWTCLIAPERYAADNEGFDARVSLETLRSFFSGEDARTKFKAGVLDRALHRFEQTGLQKKDEAVTRFRSFYAKQAGAFFSHGEINWPKARDAWWGDTWFNFRGGPLPKRVEIVHKASAGCVDLCFPNTPQETLGKALSQCAPQTNVVAVQTGKSASLRLIVEKLTDYEHCDLANPIILEAFEKVRWLADFFRKHESLLQWPR
jgi:hypothetical protein